jgi:hypothetical protein
MQAGIGQGAIISPIIFSLYVLGISSPFRHVELALYVSDTAVIATPPQPTLLVKNLETYISDIEQWLRKWRIAISVSKDPRFSSLRPVDTSRNPDEFSSSGSQSNGSIPPVILE